jgi:hypothetical protein
LPRLVNYSFYKNTHINGEFGFAFRQKEFCYLLNLRCFYYRNCLDWLIIVFYRNKHINGEFGFAVRHSIFFQLLSTTEDFDRRSELLITARTDLLSTGKNLGIGSIRAGMRASQLRERNAFRAMGLDAKRRRMQSSPGRHLVEVSSISSGSDHDVQSFDRDNHFNEISHVSPIVSSNPSESGCSSLSSDEVDPYVDQYVKKHQLAKMMMTKDARSGMYKVDFDERLALGARRLSDLSFVQSAGPTACELALASFIKKHIPKHAPQLQNAWRKS